MSLGSGSNSTILNALKASGQIASRSWSLFWGRTGATTNTQLKGSFVFVGYDRAKVSGANYTRSFSSSKSSCSTSMLVISQTRSWRNSALRPPLAAWPPAPQPLYQILQIIQHQLRVQENRIQEKSLLEKLRAPRLDLLRYCCVLGVVFWLIT